MRTVGPSKRSGYVSRCWYGLLCFLVVASGTAGAAAQAQAPPGEPAPSGYRIIRLSPDQYARAIINARGQVAFTVERDGSARAAFFDGHRIRDFGTLGGTSATVVDLDELGRIAFNVNRSGTPRAMFYDGRHVLDIGTLGGPGATAAALNDLGQVAGTSDIAVGGVHPFRWSRTAGMVDLGAAGQADPVVIDINGRRQVVGRASFPGREFAETHGFFWRPGTGVIDIGALGEFSVPTAMNDAGTVVGYGGRGPFDILGFRWTRAEGIGAMGTLPNEFTWATHINHTGQVVGATPFVPGGQPHPFLWTPGQGLLDLGTGSAQRGAGTKVNAHGMVIGYLLTPFTLAHGFIWTRDTGMIEIGASSPLLRSAANDVNGLGQVVGSLGARAVIWTRSQGLVDLNTLATGKPGGLVLKSANAISESGAILATADTGLYLLKPAEGLRQPGVR